ncbi:MAG: hypothetical protein AABY11_03195, partial [archaeon]
MVSPHRLIGKIRSKRYPKTPIPHQSLNYRRMIAANKGYDLDVDEASRLHSAEERVARIVLKQVRLGRSIFLHQLADVPGSKKERALLRLYERQSQSSLNPKRVKVLQNKMRVLRYSIALRKRLGGRDPAVYHVLAIPALVYGLDSEELLDAARVMNNIAARHPNEVHWVGAVSNINASLLTRIPGFHKNFPATVNEVLHSRDRNFSSGEILEKLGLDPNRGNLRLLNYSLQLLDCCGLATKS